MYKFLLNGNTPNNKVLGGDFMRRDNKRRSNKEKVENNKIVLYLTALVLMIGVVVCSIFFYYKNNINKNDDINMDLSKISNIAEKDSSNETNTESASTEIGKTVEESKNEINNTKQEKTNNTVSSNKVNTDSSSNATANLKQSNNKENEIQNKKETEAENVKELNFEKPVDGEVVREFAKDNLIYSATLEEWTTHTGIDIKADKTAVVKAAEGGTVKSIKNDPRYGLTIVIEHGNGMQTVYSNLLTSEFVVEGENVEKGQSIGTVGNTAAFEIADEPHLHFEILKNSIPEDPSIYIAL